MKKNISALLALIITISSINLTVISASDHPSTQKNESITYDLKGASTNEKCGDNLTWEIETIDGQNILTIKGKGEMYDFNYNNGKMPPWDKKSGNITKVIIEEGVTSIGVVAFAPCIKLESIIIPNTVTKIGKSAFSQCFKLNSITIPDSVTSIDESAFKNCTGLTSITLSNNITNISPNMLAGCSKLESITIPDSVTDIDEGAFNTCSSLSSITIPDSVTSIGNGAFGNCSSLTSITLPNSIKSIGDYVFTMCTSLASIEIPKTTTNIGWGNFYSTPWLENEQNKNPLVIINGILVNGQKCTGDVIVPDYITTIVREAFTGSEITSITIPASVTVIDNDAFPLNSNLKEIKGYTNTEAERFAKQIKIPFESLGEAPVTTSTISTTTKLNTTSITLMTTDKPTTTTANNIDDSKKIKELEEKISTLESENATLKKEVEQLKNTLTANTFGDIDGDNMIDGRDATSILTYYAKASTGYTGTLKEYIESVKETES